MKIEKSIFEKKFQISHSITLISYTFLKYFNIEMEAFENVTVGKRLYKGLSDFLQ